MDAINDKVHETLQANEFEDTPENAKQIFDNVVRSIVPTQESYEEQFSWGVRDSVHRLDANEQDELRRDVEEYQSIKERLSAVEKKLDTWGSFVKQYEPSFEK